MSTDAKIQRQIFKKSKKKISQREKREIKKELKKVQNTYNNNNR